MRQRTVQNDTVKVVDRYGFLVSVNFLGARFSSIYPCSDMGLLLLFLPQSHTALWHFVSEIHALCNPCSTIYVLLLEPKKGSCDCLHIHAAPVEEIIIIIRCYNL